MKLSLNWTLAWLVAVSLTALCVTVWDKMRARRGGWRVPERTLWLVASLGGSAAMWLTMQVVRHKTKHPSFMWGVPALIALQMWLVYALWQSQWIVFV